MENRFFGYIEGYYGKLLSWDDRGLIIQRLGKLGLNAYLYAPKEDPYHRRQWKTPYPAPWLRKFHEFVTIGNRSSVTVIPGIAPGLSFDYCDKKDFQALVKKFVSLTKTGARTLCLLMDDIPAALPKQCRAAYVSLGAAHGTLLAALKTELEKRDSSVRLLFCPTIYADQLMETDPWARRYLADLAATMPRDVVVFWTGAQVISSELSLRGLHNVLKLFAGNVCIWDNIYANDYCPHRLFLGPYEKRDAALRGVSSGIMINPTGLVHTDMFLLSLLAAYKKGTHPQKAWQAAAAQIPFAKEIDAIAPFFNLPRAALPKTVMTHTSIKRTRAALSRLIWEWKSPLQREWYSFLYMLEADLTLLEKKNNAARNLWIDKKYSPVLAPLLKRTR